MQKIYYVIALFLAFMLFSAFSCDDDHNSDEPINEIIINNNGHDYVDLGLTALWATNNVGAYSSTSQGDMYAFGESSVKSSYTSDNYVGGNADVAKLKWGGDWRLPTRAELEELVEKCSWKERTVNGVQVSTATGPSGKSIDLPYWSYVQNEGYMGWYWSSTSQSSSKAYCLYFEGTSVSAGANLKYYGFLVRPVITNPNYNSNQSNTNQGGSNNNGGTSTYEKPEIGLEDYTCYTSSITVKYRIYNQERSKVSSATGYYGTSSATTPVNATIGGSQIILRFTGLKKSTTYYIKCKADGIAGSTTSETIKLKTMD